MRLERATDFPTLTAKAHQQLSDGDLEGAEKTLNEILSGEEKTVAAAADTRFEIGRVNEMQFRTDAALEQYRQAYQYRQDSVQYARAYGTLLGRKQRYPEAIEVDKHLIGTLTTNPVQDDAVRSDLVEAQRLLAEHYRYIQDNSASLKTLQTALPVALDLAAKDIKAHGTELSSIYNAMALTQLQIQDVSGAEHSIQQEIESDSRFAANGGVVHSKVPGVQVQLGVIYIINRKFLDARRVLNNSLDVATKEAAQEKTIREVMAVILENLGKANVGIPDQAAAERCFDQARAILGELIRESGDPYRLYLAQADIDEGQMYLSIKKFDVAEERLNEVTKLIDQMPQQTREAATQLLPLALNGLAAIYVATNRQSPAIEAYRRGIDVDRHYASVNASVWEPQLGQDLYALISLLSQERQGSEIEQLLEEAVPLYRRLDVRDRNTFAPKLAISLSNLARIYDQSGRSSLAVALLEESLPLFRDLATDAVRSGVYATVLESLGNVYFKNEQNAKAEQAYRESTVIRERLWQGDNAQYGDLLARVLLLDASSMIRSGSGQTSICEIVRHADRVAQAEQIRQNAAKMLATCPKE